MAQIQRLLILKIAQLSILVHIKKLIRSSRGPLIDHVIELAQTGALLWQPEWDARSEMMLLLLIRLLDWRADNLRIAAD